MPQPVLAWPPARSRCSRSSCPPTTARWRGWRRCGSRRVSPWQPAREPWQARCLEFAQFALFLALRLTDAAPLATRIALGLSPVAELQAARDVPVGSGAVRGPPRRRPSALAVASALLGDVAGCGPDRFRVAAAIGALPRNLPAGPRSQGAGAEADAFAMRRRAVRPVPAALRAGRRSLSGAVRRITLRSRVSPPSVPCKPFRCASSARPTAPECRR